MAYFYKKQNGGLLITSIFLIVLFALLSSTIFSLSIVNQSIISEKILALRASFAAKSGQQWAINNFYSSVRKNEPKAINDVICTKTQRVTKFSHLGLAGCQVLLTCEKVEHMNLVQYKLISMAKCGSGAIKVSNLEKIWLKG